MRVLIGCEFSGVVRDAFLKRGHDAWSCDLLSSDTPGPHLRGDILSLDLSSWDLMIAHPPCTRLAVSGARWFTQYREEQEDALGFVRFLLAAPVERICLENPVSIISSRIRKPDQIIQPWMFGHKENKTTCLWLKNLAPLKPTHIVGPMPKDVSPEEKRAWNKVHMASPGPDRWKVRSKTFQGIADAMAEQWG